MIFIFRLWMLLLLWRGTDATFWTSTTPPNGDVIYACTGSTVTIPWQYMTSAGDVIGNIEWLYDGQSQELVAITTHDQFLPTPPFSHRVVRVDNAGLQLTTVLIGDTGNYTVEVNGRDSGGRIFVLRHSVFLHVTDQLMTTDGSLHVTQGSEAVLDPRTDQWLLHLQCGIFLFNHDPPFQVEWTTPSGQTLYSNDFSNHNFNLLLEIGNIESGTYTCRIPHQHAASSCLHGNRGEATLQLDKVEVRLSLLEAENRQLKRELTDTKMELQQTKTDFINLSTNLNQENTQLKHDLAQTQADLVGLNASPTHQDVHDLRQELTNTKTDVHQLQNDLQNLNRSLTTETNQLKHQLTTTQIDQNNIKADLQNLNNIMTGHLAQQVTNGKTDVDQVRMDLQTLTNNLTKETVQLKQHLTTTQSDLFMTQTEVTSLEMKLIGVNTSMVQADLQLQQRLQALEDNARHQVAFHATGLLSHTPPDSTPLIFPTVTHNMGNAYNPSTGLFLSPHDGLYYFTASTGSTDAGEWHYLSVDNTVVAYASAYSSDSWSEMSSVQAVVHLRSGQKVWVRSSGGTYWNTVSSFSGFLLSRDL